MSCCVENHYHDGDCCICGDFPLTCDLCKSKADIELPDGRVLCSDHYDETTEGETPVTEFVQQMIPTNDGAEIEVTAQTTGCEYLVITPSLGRDEDGARVFSGGLTLTHTLTGRSLGHQEFPKRLTDLAAKLAVFDWNFTDPDHFKKPENAAMLTGLREAYREWHAEDGYEEPVHYSGDSEDLKARRAADPAGTLLGEQLEWWMKHSKALMDPETGLPSWEENPKARAAEIASSVNGYGLIYLLAVLRAIDPRAADIAARDLVANFDTGDSLGEWIWQWHEELVAGKPLTLHGIATDDPLSEFVQR